MYSVSIIGSGNAAFQFAGLFHAAGLHLKEVYSRNAASAAELSGKYGFKVINQLDDLNTDVDFVLIASSDQHIATLSASMPAINGLVFHCAASVALVDIDTKHASKGVFYPLQSLSKQRSIQWEKVPFFVEANNASSLKLLMQLAGQCKVGATEMNSEQRLALHTAAVFVSNFSNAMYDAAATICAEMNIDFKLLLPLIDETAEKIHSMTPQQAQTGPALRNDLLTIEKHLELLGKHPEYQDIYQKINNLISKSRNL